MYKYSEEYEQDWDQLLALKRIKLYKDYKNANYPIMRFGTDMKTYNMFDKWMLRKFGNNWIEKNIIFWYTVYPFNSSFKKFDWKDIKAASGQKEVPKHGLPCIHLLKEKDK